MPLLGSEKVLSESIQASIRAANPKLAPNTEALKALGDGIAAAVIKHFLANAVVVQGIPVLTSGGAGSTSGAGKLG
jgi:hypothetical protein